MRKDKYASADVRVDKYNLPSNRTPLRKSTTTITGVDEEFIRNTNKCNDEISRTKVILPYKLEDGPEDNVSYGKKPPDLIDRGGIITVTINQKMMILYWVKVMEILMRKN